VPTRRRELPARFRLSGEIRQRAACQGTPIQRWHQTGQKRSGAYEIPFSMENRENKNYYGNH
jgi:hypothetical protein